MYHQGRERGDRPMRDERPSFNEKIKVRSIFKCNKINDGEVKYENNKSLS